MPRNDCVATVTCWSSKDCGLEIPISKCLEIEEVASGTEFRKEVESRGTDVRLRAIDDSKHPVTDLVVTRSGVDVAGYFAVAVTIDRQAIIASAEERGNVESREAIEILDERGKQRLELDTVVTSASRQVQRNVEIALDLDVRYVVPLAQVYDCV